MHAARLAFSLICGLLLPWSARADVYPREDIITAPAWERFSVCYDNGCSSLAYLALDAQQQEQVRAVFMPPPADAAEERARIAKAIALMERFVGAATGTSRDKGGTFNFGSEGQMDCIDESINTTLYLELFRRSGMLRHHEIANRATRGWFVFGWPHTAAVIRETQSKAAWVVDSWFLDNGEPPFILPLKTWKAGWKPRSCPDCTSDVAASQD